MNRERHQNLVASGGSLLLLLLHLHLDHPENWIGRKQLLLEVWRFASRDDQLQALRSRNWEKEDIREDHGSENIKF
ncbi:hypothetical protein B9Z55_026067 [Caenorhabditis nigoni]|uniref:Uncharacterized protein n=1 Tax=Caenorhabditis nigoni TaxID=1611254 RepID=A0A2G5T1M1_9PELO|nr:hypothetical protein B9Z55_026067 [Caenorhabditis nigoni]